MEDRRWFWDLDALTPEERLTRIIELLAKAGVRLALKKEKGGAQKIEDLLISLDSLLPAKSGPVRFGQRAYGLDRVINEEEAKLIKRIRELRENGLSTEKIAKRLNEEDKESRRAGKWSRSTVWRILKRLKSEGTSK